MAGTFTVLCATNTVKKIAADSWSTTLGADGAFESSAATWVANNSSLDTGKNRDIIIINGCNDVEISLDPDLSLGFEQGIRIPVGFKKVSITGIMGTVKVLHYNYQTLATMIADAFSDPNAITPAVNDELYPGDIIALNNVTGTKITIKFELDSCLRYSRTGFDIIGLSNSN